MDSSRGSGPDLRLCVPEFSSKQNNPSVVSTADIWILEIDNEDSVGNRARKKKKVKETLTKPLPSQFPAQSSTSTALPCLALPRLAKLAGPTAAHLARAPTREVKNEAVERPRPVIQTTQNRYRKTDRPTDRQTDRRNVHPMSWPFSQLPFLFPTDE